jgi:hypothetical protein
MNKKVMLVILMTLMSNMLGMEKIRSATSTALKFFGEATLLRNRDGWGWVRTAGYIYAGMQLNEILNGKKKNKTSFELLLPTQLSHQMTCQSLIHTLLCWFAMNNIEKSYYAFTPNN